MKIRPLSLFITTALMLAAGPIHTANAAKAVTSTAKKTLSESSKVPTKPLVNDFPTQARVEYVMQCMAEHGGANLDNSYHCVCAVDKIAGLMNFQDYSEALTFTYMFDTPGDKGGEFRDPPKSKELRDRLKAAQKEAEVCFPVIPGKITPEASKAPAETSK
ncbi:MAG: hypothetical protein RL661_735 [Pseudomonadota bacterium]